MPCQLWREVFPIDYLTSVRHSLISARVVRESQVHLAFLRTETCVHQSRHPKPPRLWQIEVLTFVDHLLRNEGKVLDHDGVNAGDVRW